jgi:hypothetical protein
MNQRDKLEGSILTPRSRSSAANSGNVMSHTASTRANRKSRCASSFEHRLPPIGLAATLPVCASRLTKRTAELAETPNLSAAARREHPAPTTATILSLKSTDKGFGMANHLHDKENHTQSFKETSIQSECTPL